MCEVQADRSSNPIATVAVPRVLWWFRLWPFWKTFFERLGCRVITNDPLHPAVHRHERASTIVEEACFPIQLLIDRTLALADKADFIFVPRLISVVPDGIMCPRFTGVPDIVRMVLDGRIGCQPAEVGRVANPSNPSSVVGQNRRVANPSNPSSLVGQNRRVVNPSHILTPIIDARLGRRAVRAAYVKLAEELGVTRATARRALRDATAAQEHFESEFERRLNCLPSHEVFDIEKPLPPGLRPESSHRVAVLGHPYVAFDWEFNLRIVERLRSLGAWVVPVESLSTAATRKHVNKLDKNVYWSSGREILGAILSFFDRGGVDGVIYLSCFKCGVDGLLIDVVRWAARHQLRVAYLPLTLDGHDNEMGLMTRLEAFVDIVRQRASASPISH